MRSSMPAQLPRVHDETARPRRGRYVIFKHLWGQQRNKDRGIETKTETETEAKQVGILSDIQITDRSDSDNGFGCKQSKRQITHPPCNVQHI